MKNYLKIFALLAIATAIASCNEEPKEIDPVVTDNNQVIFTVGGVDKAATKASGSKTSRIQTDRIALSEPGDPDQIYLIETVEDMDAIYFNTDVDTKGVPVYTETFSNNYGTFSAVPYQGGSIMTNGVKSYSAGLIPSSTNRYAFDFTNGWPGDGNILFFLGAPAKLTEESNATLGYSNLKLDAEKGTISFDYSSPTEAAAQKDLLFTCKEVSKQSYYKEDAIVLFYHTLAGVKFKSGNAVREGTSTKDGKTTALMTNITSIKLTNILSNGHCELTPDQSYNNTNSNTTPSVPKSSDAAKWTWDDEGSKEYKAYSISVDGLVSNTTQFPASTAFEGDNELGQLNMNSSNFDKTFMFVPQTTSQNGEVVLTIEYTLNGKTFRKAVNFGEREWLAGKLYTYTLSANHVGVTVYDHIDDVKAGGSGKIKTFDYIKSTGNVDEYMRVAVVGNWYDSHSTQKGQDQIVRPWGGLEAETEGIFTDGQFAPDPWIDGGDGYWYFPYKIEPGTNIDVPLFGNFTAKECPGMYKTAAHLELDIIVQAIDASWKDNGAKETKMESLGWNMDLFESTTYDERAK